MTATIRFPPFFAAAVIASLVSLHFESGLVVPTTTYVYLPPFYSAAVTAFIYFPHLLRGSSRPSTLLFVFLAFFAVHGDRHNLQHLPSRNCAFT